MQKYSLQKLQFPNSSAITAAGIGASSSDWPLFSMAAANKLINQTSLGNIIEKFDVMNEWVWFKCTGFENKLKKIWLHFLEWSCKQLYIEKFKNISKLVIDLSTFFFYFYL